MNLEVIIINKGEENVRFEEELAKDVLEIITTFFPNGSCGHLLESHYYLWQRKFKFASHHHVQIVFVGFHNFNVKIGHARYIILHDLFDVVFHCIDK